MSKKLSVYLAPFAFVGLALFLVSCGSSSSRPAGVLYYLGQGENIVGSFAIDLNSGALSLINKTAPTDPSPSSILLDPSGKVAYVLTPGSLSSYAVNPDGSLGAANPTPIPGGVAMARDAAGTFIAVVTQGGALGVFATQSGSTMFTLVGGIPLPFVPTSVAASITGTFNDPNNPGTVNGTLLHITGNQDLVGSNDNTVSEFVVQSSGAVTGPLRGSPYTTASAPTAVLTVKTTPVGGPGGLFVYVANTTTDNLNIYQVCTVLDGSNCQASSDDVLNAKMIPVGGPVSVGLDPVAMTVDPTNNFLYVVNHGSASISAFRINPSTGGLSPLNPSSVSTGASPTGVAMHSSGKFLYVSNNASSNISGFNADTTSGALSNATNVTSTAQPAGLVAK